MGIGVLLAEQSDTEKRISGQSSHLSLGSHLRELPVKMKNPLRTYPGFRKRIYLSPPS